MRIKFNDDNDDDSVKPNGDYITLTRKTDGDAVLHISRDKYLGRVFFSLLRYLHESL